MRTADRPLPPVVLDPVPTIARWPVRPVIAVEQRQESQYVWDDQSQWDRGNVWDVGPSFPHYVDATCSWTGLTLEHGAPDEHGNIPAARLVVQLDNADGRWSAWQADGSPAFTGAGQLAHLWAHNTTGDWWLFSGRIARWDQRADDTVELEAFDVFSDLAPPVGTFTPGATNDLPGTRAAAIVAAVPAGPIAIPTRFDAGVNRLTAQPTEQSPLEELQTVVGSDAGLVFVDADGTVVSYGRNWRGGRPDQTAVPTITDNVCNVPIVVWDPLISSTDEHLADVVTLENVAGLKATATVTTPVGRYTVAYNAQQWTTQAEGNATAQAILTGQSRARLQLDAAALYLLDPSHPDLWRAVDWRRFDRLSFVHEQAVIGGVPAQINVGVVVMSLAHDITPDGWVLTFSTTRAVTYVAPVLWDLTPYGWDDPNTLAVWTY